MIVTREPLRPGREETRPRRLPELPRILAASLCVAACAATPCLAVTFEGWREVPGGGAAVVADAAAVYRGKLYLFGIGINDHRHYVNALDGESWSGWAAVPGGGTTSLPTSAAAFQDKLFLFAIGASDHKHYVNVLTGSAWSGWAALPGGGMTNQPSAAVAFRDKLYLFGVGTGDHGHYVNAYDGSRWSGWSLLPGGGTTELADGAAVYGGKLYLFGVGIGDRAHYLRTFDGNAWSPWTLVGGEGKTARSDAATAFGDALYLFGVGIGDLTPYVNSFDGGRWSGWAAIGGGATTAAAPAATAYNGALYLFKVGASDRKHYVNVARASQGGIRTAEWKLGDGCQLVWNGKATGQTERRCYNDWKWRDASPLSECPGADRSGLLCYPPCRAGYSGIGPVCWQSCPAGYHDDGAFCRRDVKIIGADNSHCPWYDKCGLTFARGCSTCPDGYKNDGCTCRQDVNIFAKDTYGRGVGSPMSCAAGKERIGALCYGACPAGYTASGVYCNADKQTCMDVPVTQPPDTALLKQFCFTLIDAASWVEPCKAVTMLADSADHARQMAQCLCTNCTVKQLEACDNLDSACK